MRIPGSTLPARVKTRSITLAIVMFIGILVLAAGYFRNSETLIYLGLIVTLSGVVPELVLGLLGQHHTSSSSRRRT